VLAIGAIEVRYPSWGEGVRDMTCDVSEKLRSRGGGMGGGGSMGGEGEVEKEKKGHPRLPRMVGITPHLLLLLGGEDLFLKGDSALLTRRGGGVAAWM
jgi:hypothetical protein